MRQTDRQADRQTDRQTDRQGKRVSSFGRRGNLSLIPLYSLNPSSPPSRTLTKPTTSSRTSHTGAPIPPDGDLCPLPPPPGRKCQFVILFNALCTIFVLRALMRVEVTGNCEIVKQMLRFALCINQDDFSLVHYSKMCTYFENLKHWLMVHLENY